MPVNKQARVPLDDAEYAALVKRAGKLGIANYLRKLLGLPPRKPGRPPKH